MAFRAGYLYDKEAGPSKNITPTAPDITVHYIGFGATKKLKDFKMNITYELAIGDTRSVGDSATGLNGDYDLTSHLLAISGSYIGFNATAVEDVLKILKLVEGGRRR